MSLSHRLHYFANYLIFPNQSDLNSSIHETMNNLRSLSTISIKLNEFRQPYELITLKKKVEAARCHSCAFIKKEECAGGFS